MLSSLLKSRRLRQIALPVVLIVSSLILVRLIPAAQPSNPPSVSHSYRICVVIADPASGSVAYLTARSPACRFTSMPRYYRTEDYGQTWQSVESVPDGMTNTGTIYRTGELPSPLSLVSDEIVLNNTREPVWAMPRRTFRFFFSVTAYNADIGSSFATSADMRVRYLTLGPYGVLVGPVSGSAGSYRAILLPDMNPPKLYFDNPAIILLVTFLGLAIPPLAFLHGWLLQQIFRYLYPESEEKRAEGPVWLVTNLITGLAGFSIMIWLSWDGIDFIHICVLMTILCVLLSAGTAVYLARKRQFTDRFTIVIGLVTAFVSFLVPIGVWFTQTAYGWPVVLSLMLGFFFQRQMISRYIASRQVEIVPTRWSIDRIALESLIAFLIMLLPATIIGIMVNLAFFPGNAYLSPLSVFLVPMISVVCVALYITRREYGFRLKKKAAGEEAEQRDDSPLFWGSAWFGRLFWNTAKWLIFAFGFSGSVYIVQMGCAIMFSGFGQALGAGR